MVFAGQAVCANRSKHTGPENHACNQVNVEARCDPRFMGVVGE